MLNKKAISPVVATALLLVVAVVAVVGFQNFFGSFSSNIFSDVESENSVDNMLRVEGIFSDILYLKSGSDSNLSFLKIVDSSGNEMCSFSGSGEINSSELIGWWKLNDESSTITDLSGNSNNGKLYGNTRLLLDFNDSLANDRTSYSNNGTLMNGADCSLSGISGNGCSFDGVNDYIEITTSNSIDFQNSDFSISLWFNPNTLNDVNLIGKGAVGNSNTPGYTLALRSSGMIQFYAADNLDPVKVLNSNPGLILTNNYYHLVGIYHYNQSFEIYLNGIEIAQSNNDEYNFSNINSLIIAGDTGAWGGNYFNGSIDEITIYSKALTEEEISDLYNSQKAKFVEFKTSKLDKAVEFDGVDDYVVIINSTDVHPNNITLVSYFKSNNVSSQTAVVGKHQNNGYGLFIFQNIPKFSYNTDASVVNYSQNVADYEYEMLVGTFNGSTSSIYLNGILSNSSNVGSKIITPGNLTIGALRYNTQFFSGQIDEVRIYNRTLNDDEINSLYWYSLKPIEDGINEIEVSSCNLVTGQYYDVIAFTNKNRVEMKIIAK